MAKVTTLFRLPEKEKAAEQSLLVRLISFLVICGVRLYVAQIGMV